MKDFDFKLPPGAKVTGINVAALAGAINPEPAKPKGKAGPKPAANHRPAAILHPLMTLDVSSTATGWAIQQAPGAEPAFGLIRPPASWHATRRIDHTADAVADLAKAHGVAMVVSERADGKVAGRLVKAAKARGGGNPAAGLSVVGEAQGAVRQCLRRIVGEVHTVPQNTWSKSAKKAVRAAKVRQAFPAYARWAKEKNDNGHDAADALGILLWVLG